MDNRTDKSLTLEICDISKCYQIDNFFNLSGVPIATEVASKLKQGIKHTHSANGSLRVSFIVVDKILKIIWRFWGHFTTVRPGTSV